MSGGRRCCIFLVDGAAHAVPVSDVVELFALDELTPVPNTPARVAGVVHRRGAVLPVVLLDPVASALGAGQGLLRLSGAGAEIALPVDGVLGLRTLAREAPPEGEAPWIIGLADDDGRPVELLDVATLVQAVTHEVRTGTSAGATP